MFTRQAQSRYGSEQFLSVFGFEQPRQLCDVGRYAVRLIYREPIRDISVSECLARIHIGQGLTVRVCDFIAAGCLLDSPWRREATGHGKSEGEGYDAPQRRNLGF